VKHKLKYMIRRGSAAAIADLLGHRDRGVRETTVQKIARIKDPSLLTRLADAVLSLPPFVPGVVGPDRRAAVGPFGSGVAGRKDRRAAVGPLLKGLQAAGAPAAEARLRVLTSCFVTVLRGPMTGTQGIFFGPWSGTKDRIASKIAAMILELGDSGVAFLLEALRDPRGPVRGAAAGALSQASDPRVPGELIRLLTDSDPAVRKAVARALGVAMHKESLGALVKALCEDESEIVRAEVARALGQLGEETAREALLKALERDPDVSVRLAAGASLAELMDTRAFQPLLGMLHTDDASIRTAAARALGQLMDSRASVPLLSITSAARGAAPAYPPSTAAAIRALGQLGYRRAVPVLCEILLDASGERRKSAAARQAAAEALGMIGDVAAVVPLVKTLLDREADLWKEPRGGGLLRLGVRCAAAHALGQLGCTEALPALAQVLLHPELPDYYELADAVATALARFGKPAGTVLAPSLFDASHLVRRRTAEALKSAGWEPTTHEEEVEFLVALKDWETLKTLGPAAVQGKVQSVIEGLFGAVRKPNQLSKEAEELKHLGWAHTLSAEVIDLLVEAASCHVLTRRSSLSSFTQEVSLAESSRAVAALCRKKSRAVSNLLHLIASRKQDGEIRVESVLLDDLRIKAVSVSFATQRQAASKELKRRRFSGYDLEAYFPPDSPSA